MRYRKIFFLLALISCLDVSAQSDTACFCRRLCTTNIDRADLIEGKMSYAELKGYMEKHIYGLESLYPHLYYLNLKIRQDPRETRTAFTLYTYQSLRVHVPDKNGLPLLLNPCTPEGRLSEIKIETYKNTPLAQGRSGDTPHDYFLVLAKIGADSSGTLLRNMLPLLNGEDKTKAIITLFERKIYPLSKDTLPKDQDVLLRKMHGWITNAGQDVTEFVYRECIAPYVRTKEKQVGKKLWVYAAPIEENPEVMDRFNILFQKQLGKFSVERFDKLVHQYYTLQMITPEMAYVFPKTLLRPWDKNRQQPFVGDQYQAKALVYLDTLKFDAEKGILNNGKMKSCFEPSEISGTGLVVSFHELLPFFREKNYLKTIDPLYASISDSSLKEFSGVLIPEATITYHKKKEPICVFQSAQLVVTSKYITGSMTVKGKISDDCFYPVSGKKMSLSKFRQELKTSFFHYTLEELSGELRIRFIKLA